MFSDESLAKRKVSLRLKLRESEWSRFNNCHRTLFSSLDNLEHFHTQLIEERQSLNSSFCTRTCIYQSVRLCGLIRSLGHKPRSLSSDDMLMRSMESPNQLDFHLIIASEELAMWSLGRKMMISFASHLISFVIRERKGTRPLSSEIAAIRRACALKITRTLIALHDVGSARRQLQRALGAQPQRPRQLEQWCSASRCHFVPPSVSTHVY